MQRFSEVHWLHRALVLVGQSLGAVLAPCMGEKKMRRRCRCSSSTALVAVIR